MPKSLVDLVSNTKSNIVSLKNNARLLLLDIESPWKLPIILSENCTFEKNGQMKVLQEKTPTKIFFDR